MFKKTLLTGALIALSQAALAADLPVRTAAPAPYIAAPPIFTWTGFYMGVNAGAGFRRGSSVSPYGFTADPTVYSGAGGNSAGFTGGVQAGYNWQFGPVVAGVEGDINYIDRRRGDTATVPSTAAGTSYYTVAPGAPSNWYGTLRGRVGYAFDRVLVYGTGGVAFTGAGGAGSATSYVYDAGAATTTTTSYTSSNNGSKVGWALGGGVEYALMNNMSLKLEYLHVDFGQKARTIAVSDTTGFTSNGGAKFDVLRAGVNFRF